MAVQLYGEKSMKLLLFLLAGLSLHGQTLKMASVSAQKGQVGTLLLTLSSPEGKAPAALQWDIAYPSPKIGIGEKDVIAGGAAESSGKDLTCAGHPEGAGTYVYRCVLAGGVKPIRNGTLAIIKFQVRPTTLPGPVIVEIRNAQGASAEAAKVEIASTQAEITVR
jgi:hypothetical protein